MDPLNVIGRLFGPQQPRQPFPAGLRQLHGDRIPFQQALWPWVFFRQDPQDEQDLEDDLTSIRDAANNNNPELIVAEFKESHYVRPANWAEDAAPYRPAVFEHEPRDEWVAPPYPIPHPDQHPGLYPAIANVRNDRAYQGMILAIACVAQVLLVGLRDGVSQAQRFIMYQARALFTDLVINQPNRAGANARKLYKRFSKSLFPKALRYFTNTLYTTYARMGIKKHEEVKIFGACYVSFDRAGKWHDARKEVVTVPSHRIPFLRIMINPFALWYTIDGPIKSIIMDGENLHNDARVAVVFLESAAQMDRAEAACAPDVRVLKTRGGAYDVIRRLMRGNNHDRDRIRLAARGLPRTRRITRVILRNAGGAYDPCRRVLEILVSGRGFLRDCDFQVRALVAAMATLYHARAVVAYVNRTFGADSFPVTLPDDELDRMYAYMESVGNQARDNAHTRRANAARDCNDGERQHWQAEIDDNMPRVRIIGDCDAGGMKVVVQQLVGLPGHPETRAFCLPGTEYAGPFASLSREEERITVTPAAKRSLLRSAHLLRGATADDVPDAARVRRVIAEIIRFGAFSAASRQRGNDRPIFDATLWHALSARLTLLDADIRDGVPSVDPNNVFNTFVTAQQELLEPPQAAPANQGADGEEDDATEEDSESLPDDSGTDESETEESGMEESEPEGSESEESESEDD